MQPLFGEITNALTQPGMAFIYSGRNKTVAVVTSRTGEVIKNVGGERTEKYIADLYTKQEDGTFIRTEVGVNTPVCMIKSDSNPYADPVTVELQEDGNKLRVIA